MHGTLQLNFDEVQSLEQAKGKALGTWRQLLEDPAAELPNSVHFQFVTDNRTDAQGRSVMSCVVTLQIDRKALEPRETESE